MYFTLPLTQIPLFALFAAKLFLTLLLIKNIHLINRTIICTFLESPFFTPYYRCLKFAKKWLIFVRFVQENKRRVCLQRWRPVCDTHWRLVLSGVLLVCVKFVLYKALCVIICWHTHGETTSGVQSNVLHAINVSGLFSQCQLPDCVALLSVDCRLVQCR